MFAKSLVLVIEDNHDLGYIFGEAVRMANMDVEIIHDGTAARQRLAEVVPTVVVLDLHLPGVSGEELLRDIQADPRLVNTRVVISSADNLLVEKLRGEVDFALVKPVGFDQLRMMVARLQLVAQLQPNIPTINEDDIVAAD